jgi:hypothetical protein
MLWLTRRPFHFFVRVVTKPHPDLMEVWLPAVAETVHVGRRVVRTTKVVQTTVTEVKGTHACDETTHSNVLQFLHRVELPLGVLSLVSIARIRFCKKVLYGRYNPYDGYCFFLNF